MMNRSIRMFSLVTATAALTAGSTATFAADLDAKAVTFSLPADIKWVDNAARTNQTAIIHGDPDLTGDFRTILIWR